MSDVILTEEVQALDRKFQAQLQKHVPPPVPEVIRTWTSKKMGKKDGK